MLVCNPCFIIMHPNKIAKNKKNIVYRICVAMMAISFNLVAFALGLAKLQCIIQNEFFSPSPSRHYVHTLTIYPNAI